jgi:aspartyl-tRNA(Asn)/glutamyl-tRNA(Gln) amidotransferase subunit C
LTDAEVSTYEAQLADILGYVQKLETLDVSGIEPMAHASPVFDVMREDVARESLDRDEALANAPAKTSDQFLVPKVVES